MLIPTTLTLLFGLAGLAGLTAAEGGYQDAATVWTWSDQCIWSDTYETKTVPDGACQPLSDRKSLTVQYFKTEKCRRELYLSTLRLV
jgi:hypothetical protein